MTSTLSDDTLRRLYDPADPTARRLEVEALAVTGGVEAIAALVGVLLSDKDPAVREAAARALGEIAERLDATDGLDAHTRTRLDRALVLALDDDDYGARQSAAEMIVRLALSQRGAALALLAADLDADDAEVQLGAAWSLKGLGDHRAGDALARLTGHWNARVWALAALGLAELGDARALDPLRRAIDADQLDPALRDAAVLLLARLEAD